MLTENIWYASFYIIKASVAFYQSYNTYRYWNESERTLYEVHVLIIKSIIIFRSSTPSLYRTNIFSVLSWRRGQQSGSRETCAGSEERPCCRNALVSFLLLLARKPIEGTYNLFDLAYWMERGGREIVRNWEFVNIRTTRLFLPFLSLRYDSGAEY